MIILSPNNIFRINDQGLNTDKITLISVLD